MIPTSRSPGQTALSPGIDLVEQIVFGRSGCLIFVDFVEEVVEIFFNSIYIQCCPFLGLGILLAGCA
jgi:hypothetical protein